MKRLVAIALICSAAGCARSPISPGVPLPPGMWGGIGVRLDVTPVGASIEYDCAHGTIDEPIVADRDGRFTAAGTHVREHGGPIGVDEPPDRHPARYQGELSGNSMRLTVTLLDSQQVVGTFTATKGGAPRIVKCV